MKKCERSVVWAALGESTFEVGEHSEVGALDGSENMQVFSLKVTFRGENILVLLMSLRGPRKISWIFGVHLRICRVSLPLVSNR